MADGAKFRQLVVSMLLRYVTVSSNNYFRYVFFIIPHNIVYRQFFLSCGACPELKKYVLAIFHVKALKYLGDSRREYKVTNCTYNLYILFVEGDSCGTS